MAFIVTGFEVLKASLGDDEHADEQPLRVVNVGVQAFTRQLIKNAVRCPLRGRRAM